MLGPTCTLRNRLWAMTSLRNRDRSEAYFSRLMRSRRANFFTFVILSFLCGSESLQPIGHPEQRQWMGRRRPWVQAAFNLVSRHRTIAGVEVRIACLHALDDRLTNLHRVVAKLSLDAVCTIVTRTPLYWFHGRSGNQLQHVASLEADVLHS